MLRFLTWCVCFACTAMLSAQCPCDPELGGTYVQPTISGYDFPNDPMFEDQWGLHNNGNNGGYGGVADADLDLPQAWALESGRPEVIVVTADFGTNWDHPDLRNQLTPGYHWGLWEADPGGFDPLGNFTWNPGLYSPNDPLYVPVTQGANHGFRATGIIGAQRNNSFGIAGVAGGTGTGDGVRVMPMYVNPTSSGARLFSLAPVCTDHIYPSPSGTPSYLFEFVVANVVADILEYSTYMNAKFGAEICAVNSTIMGNFTSHQPLVDRVERAIAGARAQNILFVQSAGNSGPMTCEPFAVLDGAIGAMNMTRNDAIYCESSICGRALIAPGTSIVSTGAGSSFNSDCGTSWSSPHISGIVALLASRYPGITAAEMENSLRNTTELTSDGFERVNAYRALLHAGGYPDLPGDVNGDLSVTMDDAFVIFNFVISGAPITPAECIMDTNGDGTVTLEDGSLLLAYTLSSGTGVEPVVGCPLW